jgi:hypothetical protein
MLLTGAFPGFVWGFFQVPDRVGWAGLAAAYAWPFAAGAVTLAAYLPVHAILRGPAQQRWTRAFAAAAIAAYYWFRIPMLFGFGAFPGDGVLVDLRGTLPAWFVPASRAATTLLFFVWFLARAGAPRSWSPRPASAAAESLDGAASPPVEARAL